MSEDMTLLFLAELTKPVSPHGGGGVNKIVYYLVEELIKKKYEVVLFASGDSETSAKLVPVVPVHLDQIEGLESKVKDLLKVKSVSSLFNYLNKNISNKIVIHNHLVWRYHVFSENIHYPTITTLHNNPLSDYANDVYSKLSNNNYLISISKNQSRIVSNSGVKIYKNIYHGIPLNLFNFSPDNKNTNNTLFYIGRISEGKGLGEIIDIAKRYNKTLIIAGDKDDKEVDYFNYIMNKIKENKNLRYYGELHLNKKNEIISKSKLFLFPIKWEEPFGLVTIESMACGTPVVAYARGSIPEVVKDGETGFIVKSSEKDIRGNWIIKKTGIEGLCEAVERIYSMPAEQYQEMRRKCREHVDRNFSVEKMVNEYKIVYEKMLATNSKS
ncbi:MAG: hypothetical protein A2905_01475 [Candidatus Levybacteria bacterium RIFCSPLOWO2_01_FULL_36_10]|nr:MAG: hypothetical protein A2905_01475 [Candidatus Levybacteria bacterium RIFCSPLOWO2_01_FULL_36_10]